MVRHLVAAPGKGAAERPSQRQAAGCGRRGDGGKRGT